LLHADPGETTLTMALFYGVVVDVSNCGQCREMAGHFGQLIPLLFP
jgi:hypothetical protein